LAQASNALTDSAGRYYFCVIPQIFLYRWFSLSAICLVYPTLTLIMR
jgi:hypothetical protein